MSGHSSGYYSIDADYNIIGFNDTAKKLYPNLVMGERCYKVLMGLDSPCPPCPVANGIHGPKTYLDPIRHIYETVDAVETVHADGSRGHALVFSTVAEGERLSSAIPTGESSLRLLGAIHLISAKYSTVFGVNMESQKISVFRSVDLFDIKDARLDDNMDYLDVIELFLNEYVHSEDRLSVRTMLSMDYIKERLNETESFKIHFRVFEGDVHYYYLLIARNGEADDFNDIVVAIACEDDDISTKRIYERQLNAMVSTLSHVPGYFHLDITENKILKVGGVSSFAENFNSECSIDVLMQSMSAYIPLKKDREDFLNAYSLEAMKRDFEAGNVEIVRESRCYYDDNIARWSRYTTRLFINPSNNHLEGLFFGEDVTRDRDAYETQVSIVQTLSSNYLDVLLLNTLEKTVTFIKHEGFMSKIFEKSETNIYNYDELMEQYVKQRIHPDDQLMMSMATKLSNVMEALTMKKEYAGNYRILEDGNVHYYQFRFIKNEEYGVVVLGFLNVDEIVAAEIEQQQKLQKALDDAKRANSEKSRFLARMSHDMRTPLNGIIGILEIDKKHEDDIEYLKENRKKATIVTNHLVSLINDVLDMAKIEEGSLVLAHEPFNIIEEGREAAVIINLQAQEAGITANINFTSWSERHIYVYGSPLHLRRAMMNIYSNCIKYNRKNGEITTDIEVIDFNEKTVTYRWTISDTGIGMSQEFLTRIFEPFVQADTDARSVYQGTGLGMSIAKALIEQMGGTLEISSELNVGSRFVVTIPFELADESEVVKIEKDADVSIKGMHILLAEDNELNREIAETLLREEGAQVTSVVNGREAVDAVANNDPDIFDLVLMDVMMPVMDGHEATRQIRQMGRPDAETLPVVAMTANAFAEDIQKSFDAGMNGHITKPLEIDKMMRIIAKYRK